VLLKTLAILIDLDFQFMAWAGLFLISVLGITLGLAALFLTTWISWQIVRRTKAKEFDDILVYIFRRSAIGFLIAFVAIIILAGCIVFKAGTATQERLLIYTIVTAPLSAAIIGGLFYWDRSQFLRKRRRRRRRF
jgi:uncharacterized membrane protein YkvI